MIINDEQLKLIRTLDDIEHQDEVRKNLIRLALLKIKTSRASYSKNAKLPPDIDELMKKCHNYELTINRIKQEYGTKEKLNESIIEKLKADLMKVRKEKTQLQNTINNNNKKSMNTRTNFKTRPNLSFSTSPYLTRAMTGTGGGSSSPLGLKSSIYGRDNRKLLSRVKDQDSFTGFKGLDSSIKGFSNSSNKTPRLTLNTKLLVEKAEINKTTPSKSPIRSPGKTPSRLSFIADFDKESQESIKSPSPEFTPTTKRHPFGEVNNKSIDEELEQLSKEGPDANSTSILGGEESDVASDGGETFPQAKRTISDHDTNQPTLRKLSQSNATDDSDIFASANSSLGSNSTVIISQQNVKKKKRLNLSLENSRKITKSLNLDQDVNPIDYYKDDNINDSGTESPNNSRILNNTFEKRKRKVFKIT